MKNQEIFNIIKNEFDEEIAINATILICINKTLIPLNNEMINNELYSDRLKKQFESVLYQLTDEKISLCLDIWEVWHTFEICQDMHGISGIVKRSLKEIIHIKNNKGK
ncbi:hypothetical protein GW796_09060 [archaeon]|nr:hypothetical protein [archaeon]NCT58881.1 hypothetical protein [archaeon]